MKGIFIVYGRMEKGKLDGIQKKIIAQIRAFNKSGLQCEMKCIPRGDERCGLITAGFISLFPGVNWLPIWGRAKDYKDYDYIYLRRPPAMSFAMRKFLKEVKKLNPNIRVIMEIPTYPYDGEMQSLMMRPFLWKDRYNRKRLRGLVDALAIVSAEKGKGKVWGLSAIRFQNGYDVDGIKMAKEPEQHDCINLCCVAMFQPWHGYERLLLGMEQYYKEGGKREIRCHMIGSGSETAKYEKIAESQYLKDRVVFYGRKSGEELDRLYDQMDIGVCSLGLYKIEGLKGAAGVLKSREFMAKGLPMVTGCEIDVFQGKDLDFVCEFENDSSILDIIKLIAFYDNIQQKDGLHERIREFAFQTVDMSQTMKPIIQYLKAGKIAR